MYIVFLDFDFSNQFNITFLYVCWHQCGIVSDMVVLFVQWHGSVAFSKAEWPVSAQCGIVYTVGHRGVVYRGVQSGKVPLPSERRSGIV